MSHLSRRLCLLIAALGMASLAGPWHATAAAPEVDRPLGILISPILSEQTVLASPVTVTPPSAEDRTQRPLGVLINKTEAPAPPTPMLPLRSQPISKSFIPPSQ